MGLHELVRDRARTALDTLAVWAPEGQMTYRELDLEADRVARALAAAGVRRGELVALWLPKSTRAVAVMQAVLRLGAAYVPIDPRGPPSRYLADLPRTGNGKVDRRLLAGQDYSTSASASTSA